MMKYYIFLFIPLLFSLQMIEPFNTTVHNGDIFEFGYMGPGQTFSISINPKVTSGGIQNLGGYYDLAYITNIPYGWKTKKSDLYGNPLFVTLTSPQNAKNGEYIFYVNVVDEGDKEKLGNITFKGKIKITRDVFDVKIKKEKQYLTKKPARLYITVINKVNTGDVFIVKSDNIKRFPFYVEKYIAPNSSQTFIYEINSEEEEQYKPIFIIYPKSAISLNKTFEETMYIEPDPITDLKSINKGILIFPIMDSIIYSIAGLLANLF